MLTKMNFILIFLVSTFVSIQGKYVAKESSCDENARIDGNKLAGKWNYVAQVSIWTKNIHCGYMFLKNEEEGKFSGYWVGNTKSTFSNYTLSAYLYNDTFELSLDDNEAISMNITTCNGDTEFALEDTNNDWYYIFSKENAASKEFLYKYQLIANEKDLLLSIMSANNCEEEEKGNKEDDSDSQYEA